ncbi:MAG: DUF3412 domain-containing protein, partial [Pseudomonadales bacterium]|nr:DUF3412 domain-containing protein [Pseudomonadales bacterium]
LEAFVRLGHGIIVFPGGVGTLEEILFLLGILMAEGNAEVLIPLVFTEPASSKGYFRRIDEFLVHVLGEEVRRYYQIVEDDPRQVARLMKAEMARVGANRRKSQDAYYYNWMLQIPREMKRPFQVSHENMASLILSRELTPAELAINLRRAFSGIVSGNVKEHGLKLIREQGPFQLRAEPDISVAMDRLLREFVTERRMKLAGKTYDPCYTVLSVGNS